MKALTPLPSDRAMIGLLIQDASAVHAALAMPLTDDQALILQHIAAGLANVAEALRASCETLSTPETTAAYAATIRDSYIAQALKEKSNATIH